MAIVNGATHSPALMAAIKKYIAVDSEKFVNFVHEKKRLFENEFAALSKAHVVLKAHCESAKHSGKYVSWRDIWGKVFASIRGKGYFKKNEFDQYGRQEGLRGRDAFLRLFFGDRSVGLEDVKSKNKFQETVQKEFEQYGVSLPDPKSAFTFAAFILISLNIEMADKDETYQGYLASDTKGRLRNRRGKVNKYNLTNPANTCEEAEEDSIEAKRTTKGNNNSSKIQFACSEEYEEDSFIEKPQRKRNNIRKSENRYEKAFDSSSEEYEENMITFKETLKRKRNEDEDPNYIPEDDSEIRQSLVNRDIDDQTVSHKVNEKSRDGDRNDNTDFFDIAIKEYKRITTLDFVDYLHKGGKPLGLTKAHKALRSAFKEFRKKDPKKSWNNAWGSICNILREKGYFDGSEFVKMGRKGTRLASGALLGLLYGDDLALIDKCNKNRKTYLETLQRVFKEDDVDISDIDHAYYLTAFILIFKKMLNDNLNKRDLESKSSERKKAEGDVVYPSKKKRKVVKNQSASPTAASTNDQNQIQHNSVSDFDTPYVHYQEYNSSSSYVYIYYPTFHDFPIETREDIVEKDGYFPYLNEAFFFGQYEVHNNESLDFPGRAEAAVNISSNIQSSMEQIEPDLSASLNHSPTIEQQKIDIGFDVIDGIVIFYDAF